MSPWELGKKRNRHESAVMQYFKEDPEGLYMICQVKVHSETETEEEDADDPQQQPEICGGQIKISKSGEKNDGKSKHFCSFYLLS